MLRDVRQDSDVRVLTEHPDNILPLDLAKRLASCFGERGYEIYFRRNIYVIYVCEGSFRDGTSPVSRGVNIAQNMGRIPAGGSRTLKDQERDMVVKIPGREQRLRDIELAQKELRKPHPSTSRERPVAKGRMVQVGTVGNLG